MSAEPSLATAAVALEPTRSAPLAGQRILVVGINYAPEQTGIAPYTTQACEHFVRQGAEVLVLAGVPHYPHWSTPREYQGRLRTDERLNGVDLRRLRHVVPSRQTGLRRGQYEISFAAQVARQRLPWRPDVVLAVVPSLLSALAAKRIARRTSARLVVWVQDLMGPAASQSGIPGGRQLADLTGRLEARALRDADRVLVLSEPFRKYVEGIGGLKCQVTVCPNWSHIAPPRTPREDVRARLGWRTGDTIALHSGNMGLKQGLGNVVEAARHASARDLPIRFVLMGDGSQREFVEKQARDVPSLSFLNPAPAAEFSDILAAADVLLVNERATAVDMSLPSKLTSYFSAGVPVVAAVPEIGGTASEVRRSGAGLVVPPEDAAALCDAICAITSNTALRNRLTRSSACYVRDQLGPGPAFEMLCHAITDG